MSSLNESKLAELTMAALQRTAFVLAEPVDAEQAAAMPRPTRFARISFGGPSRGTVHLAATDGFLVELASSLLGVEPQEIDLNVHGQDAIKELANIVGGSVILELGGAECTYSLGLPELSTGVGKPQAKGTGLHCVLDSEGQALHVTCMYESCRKAAA